MSRYHDVLLTPVQAWSVLVMTIGFEVSGTLLLKASDGFSRPVPTIGSVLGFSLSVVCLAKVLEVIPTSVAYTVWTGSGSALVAVVGVVAFAEQMSLRAVAGIALVVVGVAILNFSGATPPEPPM